MGYSSGFQEVMSKRMQRIHHKVDVFRAIANFEERSNLRQGDTVHRIQKTTPRVQTYTRGTAMSIGSITQTDESLVVNVSKVAPFYVDDLDELQSNFKLQMEFGKELAIELGNFIDGDVLGEYDQADNDIDDLDMNPSTGTDNDGITLTVDNIQKFFAIAQRKLTRAKIGMDRRFAVISPFVYQVLLEYLAGRESALGDSTGLNGNVGKYYGFDLFVSNATGWSARLEFGTNPTADDTVVVNGVTWTFKAAPATAGEIDIAGSAAATLDILVDAINGTGTQDTATTYYEVSTANRKLLDGITATDGTTFMTVKGEGTGPITVSETLTAAADIWTLPLQIDHVLFGQKGATDIVIQQEPKIEVKEVPDKLGKNIIPWTLYGVKTFDEGDAMLVDGLVRSDGY